VPWSLVRRRQHLPADRVNGTAKPTGEMNDPHRLALPVLEGNEELGMSFIGVTRLRVRSVRFLPAFAVHFLRTRSQVRQAPGFQGGSVLPDRKWTFWTMTAWDSQESMRRYMTTAPHRTTMPHLLDWCDEASVVHWDQPEDALPSWLEAHRRMRESGRASKVRNPSPQHATLNYQPPRVTAATTIAPKRPK
jgi:heme-degrading monooxygenase HmoA